MTQVASPEQDRKKTSEIQRLIQRMIPGQLADTLLHRALKKRGFSCYEVLDPVHVRQAEPQPFLGSTPRGTGMPKHSMLRAPHESDQRWQEMQHTAWTPRETRRWFAAHVGER